MDWGPLIGPAVVAAAVSGIIAIIGMLVNRSTTIHIHQQKIAADIDLAEKKFAFEKQLAERKIHLDVDQLQRRRRIEVAEAVLAKFYSVRDIYSDARAPMVWAGEMVPKEGESERVKESNYAPIARLSRNREELSAFWAKEYEFAALFGEHVREPYHKVRRVHHKIQVAVETLLNINDSSNDQATRELRMKCRHEAFRGFTEDDELSAEMDAAVAQIEEICRSVLQPTAAKQA